MSQGRTRIKFCGMTRAGDVRLAAELGVDAIGLIFASGSKRQLGLAQAQGLRAAVPPLVDVVALFRNNSAEQVRQVLRLVRPSLLQFHGEEEEAFCASFQWPWLKAVAMGGGHRVQACDLLQRFPSASGLLLDSHAPGGSGGSGQAFDWDQVPEGLHRPFLLAGGIGPDNVAEAIMRTRPWGVDVSSGIEAAPGIKDGQKMRAFVEQVRLADQQLARQG